MYTIYSNIKKNCGWGISLSHFHNGKVAQPTRMLAWINGSIMRTYPSPDPSFRSGDFCWVRGGVAVHLVRNWLESVCTMKKKESHLKNNVVEWAGPNQTAFFFPSFFPFSFLFIYFFGCDLFVFFYVWWFLQSHHRRAHFNPAVTLRNWKSRWKSWLRGFLRRVLTCTLLYYCGYIMVKSE